jgi:hypothetical protein
MGEHYSWTYAPRGPQRMTESHLRGWYQTRKGAIDSAQHALDQLRAAAIRDGLGAVVQELDAYYQQAPLSATAAKELARP